MARRTHVRIPLGPRVNRKLPPVGDEFVSVEALASLGLLAVTILALGWANSPWRDAYADLWHTDLTVGTATFGITEDLRHWINDGLMAIFFFVVGLEIKREIVCGDLRDPRRATAPVLAALGGMVVPAAIYLAINVGTGGGEGWGVPIATDIAFALGLLALLGRRLPSGLRLLLLTLAIVDDVGAIIVIAIFYTSAVSLPWLGAAVATVGGIVLMGRLGARSPFAYVAPGVLLWVCTFEAGIHATIAGVVLGLLAPARPFRGRPVIDQVEQALHPWTSFVIVPVFALANAGVALSGDALGDATSSRVTWGIVVGLVGGKLLGVFGALVLSTRLGIGTLPDDVRLADTVAVAALAGIGFTVSLFIADLSFAGGPLLAEAKVGILVASIVSAAVGCALLLWRGRVRAPASEDASKGAAEGAAR